MVGFEKKKLYLCTQNKLLIPIYVKNKTKTK